MPVLKPSNLLLCELGQRSDVVKLLDFGLVQRVGGTPLAAPFGELAVEPPPAQGAAEVPRDALALQVTQLGSLLGTPAFMSPEQIVANRPLDARSDIYSLGCVAHFLLIGRPPFVTWTAMEALAAHLAESVKPLTVELPELSAELEAVVLRCLEKDAERRFPDVATLTDALLRCAGASSWDSARAAVWWTAHRGRAAEATESAPEPLDERIDASIQPLSA
jgi:serine/threonine-protein kinase